MVAVHELLNLDPNVKFDGCAADSTPISALLLTEIPVLRRCPL
jgi:hypothetical protein